MSLESGSHRNSEGTEAKEKSELGTNGRDLSHFDAQHGDESVEDEINDPKRHLLALLS